MQGKESKPAAAGVVAADASTSTENQTEAKLDSSAQKEALERQVNPKGDSTPLELPKEAQKAAEESKIDESALEGDDSAGGTEDQSAVEVTAPKDDEPASPPPAEVAEGANSKEGADASTGTITASGQLLTASALCS